MFVIQVSSGKEKDCRRKLMKSEVFEENTLFFPRRKLRIRKEGKWQEKDVPLFPGYLFLKAPEVLPEQIMAVRHCSDVFSFLKMGDVPIALSEDEERQLNRFLKSGEIAGFSQVHFEEDNTIRILKGPLKGLEGQIVKVNKRKKRIKVRLSLYQEAFLIDFGYDSVEKS